MKSVFLVCIALHFASFEQHGRFERSKDWRLYDVQGPNLFKYTADTLKSFRFYRLNDDSIRNFLSGLNDLPDSIAPVWMGGPQVASYELDGVRYKIDISQYGGFFFDEGSKKYYQLDGKNITDWHAYIRTCFVSLHNP